MINAEASHRFRPLIWVEGIIGAGKSTFSREIAKRLQLRLIEEPVEDNPYLGPFYQDPKTHAFGMQVFLLHRRYAIQQLASLEATGVGGYQGAIIDRSLSGDRVFAKLHLQEGNISELDVEEDHERGRQEGSAHDAVSLFVGPPVQAGYRELLDEAERGLLPWSHAVRVCRIPWDIDTVDPKSWDAVAETIRGACRFAT